MSQTPTPPPKTVLITGAASGIGRASAILFAQAGYRLALMDLEGSDLASTLENCPAASAPHLSFYGDVSSSDALDKLFGQIQTDFGTLDAAVNNAGVDSGTKRFLDCSESDFDRVMSINLKGTFLCLQRELRLMGPQKKGAIVNVSSMLGIVGSPGASLYSASKHGVMGLTRSLGAEFAKKGIRINAICPGGVETPMIERARNINPQFVDGVLKRHPIGRFASPEEIGRAILWLCSDDSSFVVGHGLVIDGGFTNS